MEVTFCLVCAISPRWQSGRRGQERGTSAPGARDLVRRPSTKVGNEPSARRRLIRQQDQIGDCALASASTE